MSSLFPKKSLVESVDALIQLVNNWNVLNASDESKDENLSTVTNRKRHEHPTDVDMLAIPAKKTRLNSSLSEKQMQNCLYDMEDEARSKCAVLVVQALKQVYGLDMTETEFNETVKGKMSRPKHNRGEISIPCFLLTKQTSDKPPAIADKLEKAINKIIAENSDSSSIFALANPIEKVESVNGYINVYLFTNFLGEIIPKILNETNSYLSRLPDTGARVMVEYSQPNTHKAFHVGHMRNVALGDCLVRLYEHLGNTVVAVNYFGDEGAHIASCLWLLKRKMDQGLDLDKVSNERRGEWLGTIYAESKRWLDLSTYTHFPFKGIIAAKVLEINKHPSTDAPSNWHVVNVEYGPQQTAIVVCGGEGYKVGDFVPYVPVGGIYKDQVVEPRDMKGQMSNGVIMSANELGIRLKEEEKKENTESDNSKKKNKKNKEQQVDRRILILNQHSDIDKNKLISGASLIELGRKSPQELKAYDITDQTKSILETCERYIKESREILTALERKDKEWHELWWKTRQWSLDEFHEIYKWLGARFDHDFCESECSEESRELVMEYYNKGILEKSHGAIGCRLDNEGLGFCMLLKSDGAGLYATKDLVLARKKFDSYKIDHSIYVVDAAQSLHFKQVFAVLKKFGYNQAEKCVHLPYGLVTLPSGKMGARFGNVILFHELKELLGKEVNEKYLNELRGSNKVTSNEEETIQEQTQSEEKHDEKDDTKSVKKAIKKKPVEKHKWTEEELKEAERAISVGSIRYGMLNHDTNKDIIFDLKKWTLSTGDTGPYLQYQCARVASINRLVEPPSGDYKPNWALLSSPEERELLFELAHFQNKVKQACEEKSPSMLCGYCYDIASKFSQWYSKPVNNIRNCEDPVRQITWLKFAEAVAKTLSRGLELLGIPVLKRM